MIFNLTCILIMIMSILSIIFSIITLTNKNNFTNIHDECLDRQGQAFKECNQSMDCRKNIECTIHGQPANRGQRDSHVVTGNFGDSSLVSNTNIPVPYENINKIGINSKELFGNDV
jgi:hypothetical protein